MEFEKMTNLQKAVWLIMEKMKGREWWEIYKELTEIAFVDDPDRMKQVFKLIKEIGGGN